MNRTMKGILGAAAAVALAAGIGAVVSNSASRASSDQASVESAYTPPADLSIPAEPVTPDPATTYSDSSTSGYDDLGHAICQAIGRGMTHAQAYAVLRSESTTADMTDDQADAIIVAAINAYCPLFRERW